MKWSLSLSFDIILTDSSDIIETRDYIRYLGLTDVTDSSRLSNTWTYEVKTTPYALRVIHGAYGLGYTTLALNSTSN